MTTRLVCDESSLEKSTRLLEMSGGERLRKNRVVKIVEALRPPENVDGSYTFSNTTSFQSFLLKFGKDVAR